MALTSHHQQRGFILTLELLLIITILIIGSIVGLVAIRDAVIKHRSLKQEETPRVLDQNGAIFGEPVTYDEHDAPVLVYMDRSLDPVARTLIGIRDDRFTSREAVYFSAPQCTGTPCIKGTSMEITDNQGASRIRATGAVSYLHALQPGAPNYAIGPGSDGLPGFLYRESPDQCPWSLAEVQSRWHSQSVVTGLPCEPVTIEDLSQPAETACLLPDDLDSLDQPGTILDCSCPAGTTDQVNTVEEVSPEVDALIESTQFTLGLLGVTISSNLVTICCPENTELYRDDLVATLAYQLLMQEIDSLGLTGLETAQIKSLLSPLLQPGNLKCQPTTSLQATEPVASAQDADLNALEPFTPPFYVSQPTAVSSQWMSTLPSEVEGTR